MNKGSVDYSSSKRKRKTKTNQKKTKEITPKVDKNNHSSNVNSKVTESKSVHLNGAKQEIHVVQESQELTKASNVELALEVVTEKLQTDIGSKNNSEEYLENSSSCIINVETSEIQTATDALTVHIVEGIETSHESPENMSNLSTDHTSPSGSSAKSEIVQLPNQDYVNLQGVRFTSELNELEVESQGKLHPYGLGCIQELFSFLISLCNPYDKQNTEMAIHLGLTLLGVAFEIGADAIGKHESLLAMVKDELCRNLFSVSLYFNIIVHTVYIVL